MAYLNFYLFFLVSPRGLQGLSFPILGLNPGHLRKPGLTHWTMRDHRWGFLRAAPVLQASAGKLFCEQPQGLASVPNHPATGDTSSCTDGYSLHIRPGSSTSYAFAHLLSPTPMRSVLSSSPSHQQEDAATNRVRTLSNIFKFSK